MEILQHQSPCHCWATMCASESEKGSHTSCLPDAWLLSPGLPLLLGSLFLFPPSLLCHLFMTGARCHAILSQFWISLLLAILLGCPIHGKWTTPVAVGELRGKVQGTFFLLGLCFLWFSNLQRQLFIISASWPMSVVQAGWMFAENTNTTSQQDSAPLKWASVVLKEPLRLSWGDSSHATQVTCRVFHTYSTSSFIAAALSQRTRSRTWWKSGVGFCAVSYF